MGSTFGKTDRSATNDINKQGDVVATGTPDARTVADPNMGLTPEQMRNRKLVKLGGMFLSGLSNQNAQQSGQQQQPISIPSQRMPFYGDYRG